VFESALNRGNAVGNGVKTGVFISAAVHAAVVAAVVGLCSRVLVPPRQAQERPVVIFKDAGKSTGDRVISDGDARSSRSTSSQIRRRAAILRVELPIAAKSDEAPELVMPPAADFADGSGLGEAVGREGAGPGTCIGECAQAAADLRSGPLAMGPGMTAPRLLDAGEQIRYSRQASEARVQGVMQVQCVLTVDGRVTSCRVKQSVPFMDEAVLKALMSRRYTPVLFQGRPVPVRYNFAITLKAAE
jgi:protein TonB